MKSFKAQFLISGEWVDNAVRFKTKEEAEEYSKTLFRHWTTPMDRRVVESEDEVNFIFRNGRTEPFGIGN